MRIKIIMNEYKLYNDWLFVYREALKGPIEIHEKCNQNQVE